VPAAHRTFNQLQILLSRQLEGDILADSRE
jgi:hypothetical protein